MTIYLTGFGFLFNCWVWIFGLVPFILLAGSLFLKFYEEKELKERFGHDYVKYRKNTSFLIPKIKRNNK